MVLKLLRGGGGHNQKSKDGKWAFWEIPHTHIYIPAIDFATISFLPP